MILDKYARRDFKSYEDFFENFKINVPENFNFGFDVVDATADIEPNKKCLVWCNEHGESRTFSFLDMKKETNKAVNFFKSLGIKKGDFVMLILKRRFEYWISLVALHKLGAVAIPATHLLKEKDISYRVNAADVKMIIAVDFSDLLQRIDNCQKDCPTLKHKIVVAGKRTGWYSFTDEVAKQSDIFERPTGAEATHNDDKMLIYFTSGTTSLPKMALHDFTYPLGHILTAKFWQNVEENGCHLTLADTGWAKAAWGKIYGQWISGCAVFVYDFDKFHPTDVLDIISKHNITSFCGPATVYRFLIKEDLSKYDFSKLKYCCVAGEALNPEVFNQWEKLTGHKIMEGFGQSEGPVLVGNFIWIKPKPGSMGKPSPTFNIDIVDDNGNPCEDGKEGNLIVRMPNGKKPTGLFCGYYKSPDKTKEVWHDNMYFTGDVVYKDEDGYFWFVGRADDVIKSSGYRIGPFEVESALMEHPAVLECAITAVPDSVRGQVVKATIVLAKGYHASDSLVVELQNHVKNVTAPYKYPRVVEFVDELPKTISGKIRKVAIRDADKAKHIKNK